MRKSLVEKLLCLVLTMVLMCSCETDSVEKDFAMNLKYQFNAESCKIYNMSNTGSDTALQYYSISFTNVAGLYSELPASVLFSGASLALYQHVKYDKTELGQDLNFLDAIEVSVSVETGNGLSSVKQSAKAAISIEELELADSLRKIAQLLLNPYDAKGGFVHGASFVDSFYISPENLISLDSVLVANDRKYSTAQRPEVLGFGASSSTEHRVDLFDIYMYEIHNSTIVTYKFIFNRNTYKVVGVDLDDKFIQFK